METQYTKWLQSLGRQRADMPVAVRGLPVSHTVTYPGDVTDATLYGSIKSSPDAIAELAIWSVSAPVFADGRTSWTISLTGTQTGNLPADVDGDGIVRVIYDFVLDIAQPERLFGGIFPLSGFVTEPA